MDKHICWLDAEQKDLEEKVLAEYSSDEVWQHLQYLTTLTRRAGTDDELKAANYISQKLEEYGIEREIHELDAYVSLPEDAELKIFHPVQKLLPCLPAAFTAPTPPEGIEADLISLMKHRGEDHKNTDVRGKVVLIGGNKESRSEAEYIVSKGRAAAHIYVTPGKSKTISMVNLRKTWGSPTPQTIDEDPRTPAISICNEDGRYLLELMKNSRVVVNVKARAWRGYKKIRLPTGTLRGTKDVQKFVLVAGHYCSWFTGATDNAAADSLLLEMGRIFSKYRKRLSRGIRFAWWSGHEQGTFAGSTWYVDNFWDDLRDDAIAYLSMDSIGRTGSVGFETRNTEEVRKFHETVVGNVLSLEVKSERITKRGDQSFHGMGLPSFTGKPDLIVEDSGDMFVEPAWYRHSIEDTLDKLDVDLIRIPFEVNTVSILRLCNNPVLPFEFVTMADVLKDALNDLRKDNKSAIDLTSLVAQVKILKKRAESLNKRINRNLSVYESKQKDKVLETKFDEINACLMELSRILIPILSTGAGKYSQDPWGTPFKPIPILQPLKQLNAMASGSDEYRALRTLLVRHRNEVSDALDSANRLLGTVLSKV